MNDFKVKKRNHLNHLDLENELTDLYSNLMVTSKKNKNLIYFWKLYIYLYNPISFK